jgi:hypothetical protein
MVSQMDEKPAGRLWLDGGRTGEKQVPRLSSEWKLNNKKKGNRKSKCKCKIYL